MGDEVLRPEFEARMSSLADRVAGNVTASENLRQAVEGLRATVERQAGSLDAAKILIPLMAGVIGAESTAIIFLYVR